MTPYSHLCERLFSAAHAASHFKIFQHYYFHNCPYEKLYSNMSMRKGADTTEVLSQLDSEWMCMIVGDAAMSPYELTDRGGAISYFHHNVDSGWTWLQRIAEKIPRTAWLNPDPKHYWDFVDSNRMIRQLFSMFPLTLEGIEYSIAHLRRTSSSQ